MDIMTYTGIFMDPLDPKPDQIVIEDIAHALSMISRANGHFPEVHTVAQHCIECYNEAKARNLPQQLQLFCLLHDGAEAYLGDFIHPVKARMAGYKETEERLLAMIYEKFAGRVPSEEEEAMVKEIDKTLLYFEFLHYMGVGTGEPGQGLRSVPEFKEMPRQEVEKKFLEIYRRMSF
ncbi:MAG: phosphohydrolase [Clostridiales bacterium]|nr:phosphohydrolase [Clostridiales bacterium]